MLNGNKLKKVKQVMIHDGGTTTNQSIASQVGPILREYGMPARFLREQLQFGGLIKSQPRECMVLCHPDHMKTYYYYVFVVSLQGAISFVDIFVGGYSQLGTMTATQNIVKSGGYASLDTASKGYVIGTMLAGVANRSLFKNNSDAYAEEERWYSVVSSVIESVFSE